MVKGRKTLLEHVEQGIRRETELHASFLLGIPDSGIRKPANQFIRYSVSTGSKTKREMSAAQKGQAQAARKKGKK